ncbi:MAG TPA: hypothetical protein VK187_13540, partial [Geobacteraceae bacterium]|nr:hypothetical protein [Geobacteraceae bacterium]
AGMFASKKPLLSATQLLIHACEKAAQSDEGPHHAGLAVSRIQKTACCQELTGLVQSGALR